MNAGIVDTPTKPRPCKNLCNEMVSIRRLEMDGHDMLEFCLVYRYTSIHSGKHAKNLVIAGDTIARERQRFVGELEKKRKGT